MSIKVADIGQPKPLSRFIRYPEGITVVIPTIRPRHALLRRALASVEGQTLRPSAVVVVEDVDREGAATTRHRGLMMSQTRFTAFLDDDDEFLPAHLETLHTAAVEHGAGYVWSRFRLTYPNPNFKEHGNATERFQYPRPPEDPYPLGAGTFQQWSDEQPAQTTVTTLVDTVHAKDCGGFLPDIDKREWQINGQRAGEDWDFTLRMRAAGVVFRHAPHVTWNWHHHGRNTSGLPSNW